MIMYKMFHKSDQGNIIIVNFTIICLVKFFCLWNQYHLRYWCEFFHMLFCKLYSSFRCLVWKYCTTTFDIRWKTSSILQISSAVTFPIDFVLMQYLIVFKTKLKSYCKNETSNLNLVLNQELAKNYTLISKMVLIL